MTGVRVNIAARALGVTASQVRRWIQAGAPVVRDRRPMLVRVDDLRRWRAGSTGNVVEAIEQACLDVIRRDSGDGRTAPEALRIDDTRAAALVLQVYDRAHIAITGEPPREPYSPTIDTLRAVAIGERARDARSARSGNV